jgi:hypothetical protein
MAINELIKKDGKKKTFIRTISHHHQIKPLKRPKSGAIVCGWKNGMDIFLKPNQNKNGKSMK